MKKVVVVWVYLPSPFGIKPFGELMKKVHSCISLNTNSGGNVLQTSNYSLNLLIVLVNNNLQKQQFKCVTLTPIRCIFKTNAEHN